MIYIAYVLLIIAAFVFGNDNPRPPRRPMNPNHMHRATNVRNNVTNGVPQFPNQPPEQPQYQKQKK